MKTRLAALSILAGVLAVSSPVFAHHGNAAYDGTVTELKSATVTKLSWANPHTIVEFDVKDDKGQPVHWAAELGSPSALGADWLDEDIAVARRRHHRVCPSGEDEEPRRPHRSRRAGGWQPCYGTAPAAAMPQAGSRGRGGRGGRGGAGADAGNPQ